MPIAFAFTEKLSFKVAEIPIGGDILLWTRYAVLMSHTLSYNTKDISSVIMDIVLYITVPYSTDVLG